MPELFITLQLLFLGGPKINLQNWFTVHINDSNSFNWFNIYRNDSIFSNDSTLVVLFLYLQKWFNGYGIDLTAVELILIATELIWLLRNWFLLLQNWLNCWPQSFASIEINLTGLEMILITTEMIDGSTP